MNKIKHPRSISLILTILMVLLCAFTINGSDLSNVSAKETQEDTQVKEPLEEVQIKESLDNAASNTEDMNPNNTSESPSEDTTPSDNPVPEIPAPMDAPDEMMSTYALPGSTTVRLYKYASAIDIPAIHQWNIHGNELSAHKSLFITLEENGRQYIAYCLDYGLKASSYTTFNSTNLNSLGSTQAALIKAALSYGYKTPVSEANLTDYVKAQFGATQAMIYCIRAGLFGSQTMFSTANTYLSCYADSVTAIKYFNSLASQISSRTKIPGFTGPTSGSAPIHMLEWNEETQRYEKHVTLETEFIGKCNFTNNKGITFEEQGNDLLISTRDPFPLPAYASGKRTDLGVHTEGVYYWNGDGGYQKLTSIDTDSPLTHTPFYYGVQTELPVMKIEKKDADTEEMVPNTTFQIRAAEDISTPDGTLQVPQDTIVEEITTGAEGTVESNPLYPGTYTVQEIAPADGYSIGFETKDIEVNYQKEETEIATMSNEPTKIRIIKIAKGTEKKLSGVSFEVHKKAVSEKPSQEDESTDNENSSKEPTEKNIPTEDSSIEKTNSSTGSDGLATDFSTPQAYTTDERGEILLSYLPTGTYEIRETQTLPNYILDGKTYEVTIDEQGLIEGKPEKRLVIENTEIPKKTSNIKTGDSMTVPTQVCFGGMLVSGVVLTYILYRKRKVHR